MVKVPKNILFFLEELKICAKNQNVNTATTRTLIILHLILKPMLKSLLPHTHVLPLYHSILYVTF